MDNKLLKKYILFIYSLKILIFKKIIVKNKLFHLNKHFYLQN